MNAKSIVPFELPSAWKSSHLGDKKQFAIELSGRHRQALLKAIEGSRELPLEALDSTRFALPDIEDDLQHWINEVRNGRGLVLLRGLPVDGLSLEDSERLFFGLGTHFGVAVSQSNLGEKIGHVVNIGGQDRRQRAYRNARPLNLHTDRCDTVGMMCLQPAMSGGVSGYASALAVHNELLATAPELLPPLYEGFRLHRFGEQTDESPLTHDPVPVFSMCEQHPNVVYIRGYIDLAIDEGHYELTPLQQRALDTFDEIANRPEFRLDLVLERGEATLINNARLLHRRTGFEDFPEPDRKRHLLRLWLMDPELPTVDAVRVHKGFNGIEKIDGRGTYYQGRGYHDATSDTSY